MNNNTSFWKAGHLPTLFSAFLYFDVSFMIWVLLGALGNYVASDLGLSPLQKGLMTAIPLLGGSILRLLFGQLTDLIGPKKTGCLGLALTLVPLLGGWLWAHSINQVYLVGLLLGVAGASFAVALPMASRWYPAQHQGLAMGIAGAGNSGTLLATLFAPRLAEHFGWHAVFGLAIIPLAIAAVIFILFAKEAPGPAKKNEAAEFVAVLKERDTYLFGLFYGVTFGGFVGLASFLSIFLRDQYGVSKVTAGDLTSLCVVSGSFLRPVGGLLADKLGGIRMLTVLYGLVALLILGVAQVPALWLGIALLFLLMACLGIGNGSVFQLVPQRYGKRVGVATGILGAAGGLGGFFLPTLLGWLKQTTGTYTSGLAVLAALAIVALVVLAVVQSEWVGNWIAKHGRVHARPAVGPDAERAPLEAGSHPLSETETTSPRTLIDDLLAEQRQLTAVEKFSRAHDAHEVRSRRYRDLLPTAAPAPGQQYAFEVDLDQCSGCKACVTACHSLNGLDDDETWRSVGRLVSTDWRAPLHQTVTTACHHCVDPGCLNGCPVLAYDKDPVTGIVRHLDDQCIGCQYCVMKCPYEVPQYRPKRGIVRKCDMCSSRLAVGEAPACVQACPNEAIKITVVEQAKVRGKYRIPNDEFRMTKDKSRSPSTIRHSSFVIPNVFLPASPNPAITLPTTRYITKRTLPADLEAADAHELQPSPAHRPLTFLLVLSQLGVGLALINALGGGRSRAMAFAALVATLVAVIVGTLHLGQPLKAWRSFLGWRKSWFSRELIAFGAFLGLLAAHVVILHPLSSLLAALAGFAAVACSAMIYVDTRRPFWNAPMTFGKFFGTTLLLGAAGALTLGAPAPPERVLAALVVAGLFLKLAAENRIFRFLVDEQNPHLTALNKTALLLTGRFGLLSRVRTACAVAGVILLLTATFFSGEAALAAVALSLCVVGEFIERHLFFVAEVAPKMPGGGTA